MQEVYFLPDRCILQVCLLPGANPCETRNFIARNAVLFVY